MGLSAAAALQDGCGNHVGAGAVEEYARPHVAAVAHTLGGGERHHGEVEAHGIGLQSLLGQGQRPGIVGGFVSGLSLGKGLARVVIGCERVSEVYLLQLVGGEGGVTLLKALYQLAVVRGVHLHIHLHGGEVDGARRSCRQKEQDEGDCPVYVTECQGL